MFVIKIINNFFFIKQAKQYKDYQSKAENDLCPTKRGIKFYVKSWVILSVLINYGLNFVNHQT